MAVDKLVDSTQLDADLTSVANAIRTKGGTSADLAFPAGFVSAVEAIPTGGGTMNWDDYATGRFPTGEAVLSDSITAIVQHFNNLPGLTGVTANGVTSLSAGAFENCTHMLKGIFHACTTIGTTCFEVCGRLETAKQGLWVFPALTAVPADSFRQTNIGVIDLGPNCASIAQRAFYSPAYGGYIGEMILRKTNAVVTVTNANGLQKINANTKVYVPSALIESYKAATNWSTVGDVFYPIEGSIYETQYADGTPVT